MSALPDSGETWEISDPNALYTGTVHRRWLFGLKFGRLYQLPLLFDTTAPEIGADAGRRQNMTRLELDILAEYASTI